MRWPTKRGKPDLLSSHHEFESWVTPVSIRPTQGGGMEYIFRIGMPFKMAIGITLLAALVCAGSFGLYLWLGELGPFAVIPGINRLSPSACRRWSLDLTGAVC